MKIVFFSDVHMARTGTDRAAFTLRFLADTCEDADMVVVLGDLFDFYHGYDGYIYPWYRSVTDGLKSLVNRGKAVFFLEGNHEFDMGKYFEEYTGATCTRELTLDVEGKKVFIAHGDGFSKFSLARFLKRPFFYRIMDLLGPTVTWGVVTLMRPVLSRREKGYSEEVRNVFRSYARTKFAEGYDVVILAHSHIPDILETDDATGKQKYFNTGDLVRYSSFVLYETSTGFSLKTLNPASR